MTDCCKASAPVASSAPHAGISTELLSCLLSSGTIVMLQPMQTGHTTTHAGDREKEQRQDREGNLHNGKTRLQCGDWVMKDFEQFNSVPSY